MIKLIKNRKKNVYWKIFKQSKKKNSIYVFSIILSNITAAFFEGGSFAIILIAFSIVSGDSNVGNTYSWIKPLLPYLSMFSSPSLIFVSCVVIAIGLQVFRSALTYIGQYLTSVFTLNFQTQTQLQIYKQILKFSFPCVSKYKVGDLAKYAENPSQVFPWISDSFNKILISAVIIGVYLGIMFWVSWKLTIITFSLFIFFVFFQKIVVKRVSMFSKKLVFYITDFGKQAVQSLYCIRIVHLFNRQKNILENISQTLNKVSNSANKLNLWNNSLPAINEIIGISLVGIVLVFGSLLLSSLKDAYFPLLMTFIAVTYRLATRLQILMGAVGTVAYHWGGMIRIKEILKDDDKDFAENEGEIFHSFSENIVFQNVSLKYASNSVLAIDNFSLTIPKNTVTAIVGSSGAGKSSLIDLLTLLYRPTLGKILVDGVDLQEYSMSSWREFLGVVNQDVYIFNDTIRENIRFGRLNATEDEIIQISKAAHIHDVIESLPEKYETIVGERGYRLSGGERQRISIARAMLRDPDVLIFDEATSNLDSHSENFIQEALKDMKKKKTMIIVAHRLSTVFHADQIVVLNKGKLVEVGSHTELLKKGKYYKDFWKMQSRHLQKEGMAAINS